MQTGKAGGALSAAQGPDVEALLDNDLADIDELLASVALEPPRFGAATYPGAQRRCSTPKRAADPRRCPCVTGC